MYQTFRPLLDALKERGADPEAVDRAAEEAERTGRSIRAVLINDHVVTEEQLTEASADAFGIATLDLVGYPIDPAAVTRIPMALVLRHRVLGIALNDTESTVGITDPGDVLALDDVRAATGLTVRPVVVARSALRKIIDRLKREENDLGEVAESLRAEAMPAVSNLSLANEDAPIVRYVNSLLEPEQLRAVRDELQQAARDAARHRPDRLRQVDDPVRDARRDQQADRQHHHRRGPGRVPVPHRQRLHLSPGTAGPSTTRAPR